MKNKITTTQSTQMTTMGRQEDYENAKKITLNHITQNIRMAQLVPSFFISKRIKYEK